MTQALLAFDPMSKRTRKQAFLEEMNRVVPWAALVALIEACPREAAKGVGGRPPFAIESMLRIHCLQLWWNLSDPAMEEELHERPLYRRFAKLDGAVRMPDETTILRFRRLLEKHTQASALLHGQESELWGDAGYQGLDKREEFKERTKDQPVRCNIAMRPGKRRALDPEQELHQLQEKAEQLKASIGPRYSTRSG